MSNGSGVSRGDRNRNARLERVRALVPVINAIVGIDLAGSKQMVVVTDHDSKVIARRTFRCRAWDLGVALDWAADRASPPVLARFQSHSQTLLVDTETVLNGGAPPILGLSR